MKIIWLVNVMLPQIARSLGREAISYGGWLVALADAIAEVHDLTVLFPLYGQKKGISGKTGKFEFYGFCERYCEQKVNPRRIREFTEAVQRFQPDLVHIWGSEYLHSYEMMSALQGKVDSVLSIQGLVSLYAERYMAALPEHVQKGMTFRDLVKRDNLLRQQEKFVQRGEYERLLIREMKNVIGRTDWDHEEAVKLNPGVRYFKCGELLRDAFYCNEWSFHQCTKYSILVGQGGYPIKGLHLMIRALPLILQRFPDTVLSVTDGQQFVMSGIKKRIKADTYHCYINHLIRELGVADHIVFLERLTEEGMCKALMEAHVAVLPSSIENSSNFLGEAMILGVPVVASRAGGTSSMLEDEKEGLLYRWDAPDQLARCVCRIFEQQELAETLSGNARQRGHRNHDREKTCRQYLDAYEEIKTGVKAEDGEENL